MSAGAAPRPPDANVAEFWRASHWQVFGLGMAVVALVGASDGSKVSLGLAAVTIPFAIAEAVITRRFPFVALTGSEIVVRTSLVRRRRLAYPEVAAWAHSHPWLAFETLHGRRIHIHLQNLEPEDRARLIRRLEALGLGQPGFAGVTAADLRRRTWRIRLLMAVSFVLIVAGTTAYALWAIERQRSRPDVPPVPAPGRQLSALGPLAGAARDDFDRVRLMPRIARVPQH
ncbi:MAG TPA: hypothetical protein VKB65_11440 [Myxococcota bacterium]|nr:hypothetical protein [Myxococcota bacterium]